MNSQPLLDFERLAAIQARADLCAQGPWKASIEGVDHTSGSSCILTAHESIDLVGATDNDIQFIAQARQDIPYLVAELRRLAAIVEQR